MHSYNDEEILSPVMLNRSGTASPQTRSPVVARRTLLTTSDVEDTDDSEEEQFGYHIAPDCDQPECLSSDDVKSEESGVRSSIMSENKFVIGVVILVIAVIAVVISSENLVTNNVTLDCLKKEFPLQDQDFWIALETGLQEVVRFKKPSVFLFLYKEDGESTTDKLLTNIATYASCVLNNCNEKPIVLSSEDLSNNEILKVDGGHLLNTYKSDLETVHVMIVKNLENVPSYAAKVLHSFCDDISPAVGKSVFFLTLKVPEFPKKEMRYVRLLLKEKWQDIKEDHFEPLFARISSMILPLKS